MCTAASRLWELDQPRRLIPGVDYELDLAVRGLSPRSRPAPRIARFHCGPSYPHALISP
jgi:hypothetical protein